jgi:hypothetical protein
MNSLNEKEKDLTNLEKEDIKLNINNLGKISINKIKFQKMLLFYNSLEDGWSIKKQNNSYIFTKKHENKREILQDSYLSKFMNQNLDINTLL